jgi:hypothetical protein
MKLTWRTHLGHWAFQPNPSLADRLRSLPRIRGARSPGVAAGRRPVALTLTSSIARAGETGVTGSKRHTPAGTPAADVCLCRHARARPVPQSAFAETPPARPGSFAKSRLLRVAFRYPFEQCAAWPGDAGPSRLAFRRPTAFRGFSSLRPFAGLIPRPGGQCPPDESGGLASDQLAPISLSPRHFCRSGPTCRSCLCVRPD